LWTCYLNLNLNPIHFCFVLFCVGDIFEGTMMTFAVSVGRGLLLLVALFAWAMQVGAHLGMGKHRRFVDIRNIQNNHSSTGFGKDHAEQHDNDDVQKLFLTQRLNHFAPSQGHTYEQRYYYSDRHVDQNQTNQQYAFLCVGGESDLESNALVDSLHCSGDMLELASLLHVHHGLSVHLFALEHRYYGSSYPSKLSCRFDNIIMPVALVYCGDLIFCGTSSCLGFYNEKNESVSPVTNENLVYLSSRQALADLAHFVEQMTTKINRPGAGMFHAAARAKVQWVTFGGSYPGMLAAWARLKYPHLIFAAVSNSAPIQVQMDMSSYNDQVAFDLQYPRIGGSQECHDIIAQGHADLSAAVHINKEAVAKAFHFCNASMLDYKGNVRMWLGDGVVEVPAQSNDPSCNDDELCNIDKLCSYALEQQQNKLEAWEILASIANKQMKVECLDVNWNQTLDHFADPQKGQEGGLRSWVWQTCTEFGFFQTCEKSSNCPFGRGYHTLADEEFQVCRYAFGIEDNEVKDSIEQTKEYYGGRDLIGASHILSVNGDVDPWGTLARVNSTNDLLPAYEVAGASHHFWTHPVKDTDGDDVQRARELIYRTVAKWLLHDEDEESDLFLEGEA
jgi:thymus-specific serine protease